MTMNLRTGLFLQLFSLIALSVICLMGTTHAFGLVSLTTSDVRMNSGTLALAALLTSIVWLFSTLCLAAFRNVADDEGSIKFSRGYRAGVKTLSQASLLDAVHAAFMVMFFYAQLKYLDDKWLTESVTPNPMVIYGMCTRLLHGFALILYGGSFFLMEAFHPEGTAELWAWVVWGGYKASGLLEILAVITGCRYVDAIFTVTLLATLVVAFTWAQSFEQLINANEVALDQSALRTEYFKSKNAMAYYGPPIEPGVELRQE